MVVALFLDFPARDPRCSARGGEGKEPPSTQRLFPCLEPRRPPGRTRVTAPRGWPSTALWSPKLRPPWIAAPPQGTDPAPFARAGTPAARRLQDNPSPGPEIPELLRSLPGLPRTPAAEAAEIAEGRWPRPRLRRRRRPATASRAGWSPRSRSLPPPFSPPAFPGLPQWRVGGSRPVSSFRSRAPPPPQTNSPPHASGARTAPFLPRPGVWRGAV